MNPSKNPATVYLSKWPKTGDTRKTMHRALGKVTEALGSTVDVEAFAWHTLRYEDVRGIGAAMKDEGYSIPTVNKSLVALRGVLESAWRAGLIPDEDYRRIEIKNERGSSKVSGRALSREEMDAILENLHLVSLEEQAVMALLCATGMRRVELARLRQEDLVGFDRAAAVIAGVKRIVVRGKGEKSREIPIAPRWLQFIEAWWAQLKPGAIVFPKFNGATAMSRRTISYIVERFWKDAGLQEFSPHDLRRTFITFVCESSDISVAAKLAGHSSVNTTMIYDRRGKSAEDDAVEGV